MNSFNRTLTFLGVAGASLLLAIVVSSVSGPSLVDGFEDVGQVFFPDLEDGVATELVVSRFDTELEEVQEFAVKQNDDGLWVIPSHHDYPAEAEDRLARTATSMLGIRKLGQISRSKDDWERYGVADPQAEVSLQNADSEDDGKQDPRGTRLILRDNAGNALVDLIVGNSPEGKPGQYYVREPEKNSTYIAEMSLDLSTRFGDWIEPDLLKVDQPDVKRVLVNSYSVDEQRGEIVQGEILDFQKDDSNSWELDGLDTETEQTKASAVTDLVRNLDELRIVGVRPKPEGLNADLTVSPEVAQNPLLRQVLQADMARQGFFIARGPDNAVQLVSNEGELVAGTTNGVRYTLYFGEIARGSARDIEVGLGDAPAEEAGEAGEDTAEDQNSPEDSPEDSPEGGDESESGPRRYLLVKVDYDEGLLGERPTEPVAPVKPEVLLDAEKAKDAGDAEPAAENAQSPDAEPDACDEGAAAVTADEPAATESEPVAPTSDDENVTTEASEAPAADEKPAADGDETAPAETDANETGGEDESKSDETPQVDPVVAAQQAYDAAVAEFEGAKLSYESAIRDWDRRSEEGKKQVDELSIRFSGWYYVITAESFEKFQLSRENAVEPRSEEETAAEPPAGLPGGLSIPGLGGTPLGPPPGGN